MRPALRIEVSLFRDIGLVDRKLKLFEGDIHKPTVEEEGVSESEIIFIT